MKTVTGIRINKTWLSKSFYGTIISNRLKRRKSDAENYYHPIDEKRQFNEEGC